MSAMKRLLCVCVLLCSSAMAQISFVNKCTGTTSCASVPAHQAGDLFVAYAGANLTITAPTLPAGWTSMGTQSINGTSTADSVVLVACKVATSSSETVTGFTGAGALVTHIYRGGAALSTATCATANGTPSFFASTVNTTSTTETFSTVTNAAATSWDVGFGYAPAATAGIATAPASMTNRASQGTIMGGHDTNAAVASFSTANVTLTTAGRIITAVVQLKAPTADAPTITPSGGSFSNDTSFTITNGGSSVSSPGFCYTTDGSTPNSTDGTTCSAGTLYSGAVTVSATATTVKAIAIKSGANNSSVTTSSAFTLTAATPVASPATESFVGSVTVALTTATTGATIHSTSDGSAPSCASGTTTSFNLSATTTIKSVACKTNYVTSAIQSDVYTLHVPQSYTVKAGGGGTYTTIQACATAAVGGDTCTVFAGTYNEDVTLSAGAAGAYSTVQVNSGDTVNVYSFTVASYTKVIGFVIHHDASPGIACISIPSGSTTLSVISNTMSACGANPGEAIHPASGASSYVSIQNNTISYPCTTAALHNTCAAMSTWGDHWLVEGNNISHASDAILFTGTYQVIRNNTLGPFAGLGQVPTDCGTNSGNCHIDSAASEPSVATQYNLIEGNTIVNNLGTDGHGFLAQGDTCGGNCFGLIIRFNKAVHVGAGAILDSLGGFFQVKSYNNTWADFNNSGSNVGGITSAFIDGSTNAASINELFYYDQSLTNFNPYTCNNGAGVKDDCSTFSAHNNIAWCTGASCTLHGSSYGTGNFTDDTGNIKQDPQFSGYSSSGLGDLHLAVGSPALGAGGALTTANGAGVTSQSLVVNDDMYFSDGSGIVNADWVCVGTASNCSQISSITRGTHTLNLVTALTWSNGAGVFAKRISDGTDVLTGAAPNMGALGQALAPAVTLTCPAACTTIAFGNQTTGSPSAPTTVTLTNSGNSTLNLTSATITGTNADNFAISNNTCSSTVAAGATCTLDVTFTPLSSVAKSASLVYTNSNATPSTNTVTLTGTGTGPPSTLASLDANGRSEVGVCIGQSATLNYSDSGGTGLTASIDNGVGSVGASGSTTVSPTTTTTYTLTASSSTGTAQATAKVNVTRCGSPF